MNLILINCGIFLITLNIAVCHKRDKEWKKYLSDYDKNYNKEDEPWRRKLWEATKREIEKHNKGYKQGLHNYSMGLNHMSDLTKDEQMMKVCKLHPIAKKEKDSFVWVDKCDNECFRKLPKQLDWRSKKVITPVKEQGDCGSCWAFGTVGALEAHNAMKTGHLVELSEQQLVDCSNKYGNHGCEGGFPSKALKYVIANKGLSTEKNYPYKANDDICKKRQGKKYAAVREYKKLKSGDERNLKVVLARRGPVITAIFASDKLKDYKQGVFHDEEGCKDKDLTPNHAVLIVGYGVEKGTPYWLIKNSWGKHHGDKGYYKMIRNHSNQCLIASSAILPIMSKS